MSTDTMPPAEIPTIRAVQTRPTDRLKTQDETELERVQGIQVRRMYMASAQFEADNDGMAKLKGLRGEACLPEHEKKLAYSTQISECVNYIASQLTASFAITANDPVVGTVIAKALAASPALSASPDDLDEVSIIQVVKEAAIAGDGAAHVRWDAMAGTAWAEFWESELVEFVYDDDDIRAVKQVKLRQLVWVPNDAEPDNPEQRLEVKTWELAPSGECMVTTTYDGDNDRIIAQEFLGLPFIPWRPIRINADGFRPARGLSIITDQAMRLADRYNATEGLSFEIARYNSHATLVLTGDVASLNAQTAKQVNKDVSDVLVLRAGEGAFALTLPTDAQMIEHQREVLLDALYGTFGLVRIDTSTVQAMGATSGYALEILSEKSAGTFAMLGRQIRMDLRVLVNMVLDVDAYKRTEAADLIGLTDDMTADEVTAWVQERMARISPSTIYGDRAIEVSIGTGSVVDVVVLRQDYIAKVLSRRQVLRERGYGSTDILRIEDELRAEQAAEADASLTVEGELAALSANRKAQAIIAGNGGPGATTKAGNTVAAE